MMLDEGINLAMNSDIVDIQNEMYELLKLCDFARTVETEALKKDLKTLINKRISMLPSIGLIEDV